MIINIRREPIKYIEVTDFLDQQTLDRWIATLDSMPSAAGDVTDLQNVTSVTAVKQNKNSWLSAPNDLGLEFRDRCWGQLLKDALENMGDYLFQAHRLVDEGSMLYSVYEQGDYYQWHRDRTPYLTYNLVLESAEEGGEFQISTSTQEPYTAQETLANTSNTLIIFPSFLLHQVRPVIRGQRKTLQYFQNSSRTLSQSKPPA